MPRLHSINRTHTVRLGIEQLEPRLACAAVPTGFVDSSVAVGLNRPVKMAATTDGRIFVAEQGGAVRVIQNDTLLARPLLRLDTDPISERGLLGIAVDPEFAANGFVYIQYTTSPLGPLPVHNRVSRFTVQANIADPASEQVLLELDAQGDTFHNGGAIQFGSDGRLYIATGDNGTKEQAQSLGNLFGKMLRINPDGTIPADNPFFQVASGKNKAIWALGLRNPFSFAVQPGTGRMFINDVGAKAYEEINEGVRGANYGWPTTEGPTGDPRFESPRFAYGHGVGDPSGCAISGAAFYPATASGFPGPYHGDFFFADYCTGAIWNYDLASDQALRFATGVQYVTQPVDVMVHDGDLYYLMLGDGGSEHGRLQRISFDNDPPVLEVPPAARYVEGHPATRIAPLAIVSDADSPDFAGGQLRIQITHNAEALDRLVVLADSNISLIGNDLMFRGVAIGTVRDTGVPTLLVFQLNANATPLRVQALLRHVAFHNGSDDPSNVSRMVSVKVADGDGRSAIGRLRLNVSPVNDAPVLSGIGGSVGYVLNGGSVALSAAASVADVDSPNFAGGRLLARITAGIDASNRLLIRGGFTLEGDEVRWNGLLIGARNANGGTGTTNLLISLNGNATLAIVERLVRSIRFRTVGSTLLQQRTIAFSLTDGDGGASETLATRVNVTA